MNIVDFRTFDEALQAIQVATSEGDIKRVVERVDQQFEDRTLDLEPSDWGRLASVVLLRGTDLKLQQLGPSASSTEQVPGTLCPAE